MTEKPKLTEEERLAELREWDNTPSPNPRLQGHDAWAGSARDDAATEAAGQRRTRVTPERERRSLTHAG